MQLLREVAVAVLFCCLLSASTLILPIPLAGAQSSMGTPHFLDHFDQPFLDASKWVATENTNLSGYPAYGGHIQVNDSSLLLSSNGSSFPWITTASNPFPVTGGFVFEAKFGYSNVSDLGDGMGITGGELPVWYNDTSYQTIQNVFWVWTDSQGTRASLLGHTVWRLQSGNTRYQSPYGPQSMHIFNLAYLDGVYTLAVDGKVVAQESSEMRPNRISIGHPYYYYVPFSPEIVKKSWGWTSSMADYVQTAVLTAPPTPLPSDNSGNEELGGYFSDHFGGSVVNSSKWAVQLNTNVSGYPAFGGLVKVANSTVSVSSTGSTFPCVTSRVNPFPTTGDFAVIFDFTYTRIRDFGDGLWFSNGPFIVAQNGSASSKVVLQLWADRLNPNQGSVRVNLLGQLAYQWVIYDSMPSYHKQTFKLSYYGGTYILTVDGIEVVSMPSQLRPDTIGFGHPPAYYLPFGSNQVDITSDRWSAFQMDAIQVLEQSRIEVSTSVASTQLGLTVDFNGILTAATGEPVQGKSVVFSYQVPSVPTWNAITSVTTDVVGAFSGSWLPTATGNFIVKAEWHGDDTYSGASDVRNISVTRAAGQNLVFVESNSTLSSLSLNSTDNEVSFTVSGPSGTAGYVRFFVSKALMGNLTEFKAYLDGNETTFTLTEQGDMMVLYFEYQHSTHVFTITHAAASTIPEFPSWVLLPLAVALMVSAVALKKRRKGFAQKTTITS
jgi:hypothetical protein